MIASAARRIFLFLLFIGALYLLVSSSKRNDSKLKLYWFIPDGTRNDAKVFDLYKLANDGYLPNLKKLIDGGSYGYSIPDFPSHTPTNFATLLTGSHPDIHGISDGSIHIEGYPLNIVPIGGFRSNAKKVPPAWTIFEQNNLHTFLLSIPGSSPPEISNGETVRGRWGGWGADFYAVTFNDSSDELFANFASKENRLFNNGPELMQLVTPDDSATIPDKIVSFSRVKHIKLDAWDGDIQGYIHDTTDDQKVNYDHIAFTTGNGTVTADLKPGEWSGWLPVTLKWRTRDDFNLYTPQKSEFEKGYATVDVPTFVKIKVIRLEPNGIFSVRLLYNVLNSTLTAPDSVAGTILKNVGPMVDFPDNYPPQLVYHPEDKQTFLEESDMALDWHKRVVSQIVKQYSPQVVIQDTYTPNQMLTSRWWMKYIDPKSTSYNEVTEDERKKLWTEVHGMYKKLDDILGEILKNKDPDTLVVFSSDHGAAVLNKEVYLNNIFAKENLLKIVYNKEQHIFDVDFDASKVVFLQNTNIYINPNGLGGNWKRSSGPEYEALRERVVSILKNIKDDNGISPLSKVVGWEDAQKELGIPVKQAGDLVIANTLGYNWTEEVTDDGVVMKQPLRSGYKQGILAENEPDVWSSFVIMGPGVKKGYKLGKPISNADQLPTILKLLHIPIPKYMQGKVVQEALER